MDQQVKTSLGVAIIIIFAITVGFFAWKTMEIKDGVSVIQDENIQKDKACTQEAKQCPDGSFVGRIGPDCGFAGCPEVIGIKDKIIISAPRLGEKISDPILVSGRARGTWFFEGSFPVEIYDATGKMLGEAPAEFVPKFPEDEWMTEEFVDFKGEIKFDDPKTDSGYILFKKDNPSDQRELDESFKLPVKFSKEIFTAGWKTYRNEKYGYEMKYPSDWRIGVLGLSEPTTFSAPDFSSPECLKPQGICPRFMVGNIHKAENGETIENKINLNTNDKILAQKTVTISEEEASFVEYLQANYGRRDGKMGLVRQEIKMVHDGTIYRIYVDEYNPDIDAIKTSADWENNPVFEAMIKSFKFIDSTEAANRKNYRNKKYGFELTLWSGYTIESDVIKWGELGESESVRFTIPGEGEQFCISFLSKKQWDDFKNEPNVGEEYLGENKNYVFIWAPSQDVGNIKEIRNIIKTFKIIQ